MLPLNFQNVRYLILHCSASYYGNVELITEWHTAPDRNYDTIGYHHVITNGYWNYEAWVSKQPDFNLDGAGFSGRDVMFQGAHCKGHNAESIGICMIGQRQFTRAQFDAFTRTAEIYFDSSDFPLLTGPECVRGHYELLQNGLYSKTCPNIHMDMFRAQLAKSIQQGVSSDNRRTGLSKRLTFT